MEFVAATVEMFSAEKPFTTVVEFGSKDINGSVRPLFCSATYTGVDIVEGPGVDVVADATTIELPAPVDCIVSTEVLEHLEAAPELVANAYRNLKPGGVFIVTAAGPGRAPHSAIDENPIRPHEFYRNVSQARLKEWLLAARFPKYFIVVTDGNLDIYAWAVK